MPKYYIKNNKTGEEKIVSSENIVNQFRGLEDFSIQSDAERQKAQDEEKYGGFGGIVKAGLRGFLRGQSFGLTDVIGSQVSDKYKEEAKKLEEVNPISSKVGEFVGMLGGLAGGHALVGAAAKAAGIGTAAKATTTAGKIASGAVRGAAEGAAETAAIGAGQAASDVALGREDAKDKTWAELAASHTIEGMPLGVGLGAVVGAALPAARGLLSASAGKQAEKIIAKDKDAVVKVAKSAAEEGDEQVKSILASKLKKAAPTAEQVDEIKTLAAREQNPELRSVLEKKYIQAEDLRAKELVARAKREGVPQEMLDTYLKNADVRRTLADTPEEAEYMAQLTGGKSGKEAQIKQLNKEKEQQLRATGDIASEVHAESQVKREEAKNLYKQVFEELDQKPIESMEVMREVIDDSRKLLQKSDNSRVHYYLGKFFPGRKDLDKFDTISDFYSPTDVGKRESSLQNYKSLVNEEQRRIRRDPNMNAAEKSARKQALTLINKELDNLFESPKWQGGEIEIPQAKAAKPKEIVAKQEPIAPVEEPVAASKEVPVAEEVPVTPKEVEPPAPVSVKEPEVAVKPEVSAKVEEPVAKPPEVDRPEISSFDELIAKNKKAMGYDASEYGNFLDDYKTARQNAIEYGKELKNRVYSLKKTLSDVDDPEYLNAMRDLEKNTGDMVSYMYNNYSKTLRDKKEFAKEVVDYYRYIESNINKIREKAGKVVDPSYVEEPRVPSKQVAQMEEVPVTPKEVEPPAPVSAKPQRSVDLADPKSIERYFADTADEYSTDIKKLIDETITSSRVPFPREFKKGVDMYADAAANVDAVKSEFAAQSKALDAVKSKLALDLSKLSSVKLSDFPDDDLKGVIKRMEMSMYEIDAIKKILGEITNSKGKFGLRDNLNAFFSEVESLRYGLKQLDANLGNWRSRNPSAVETPVPSKQVPVVEETPVLPKEPEPQPMMPEKTPEVAAKPKEVPVQQEPIDIPEEVPTKRYREPILTKGIKDKLTQADTLYRQYKQTEEFLEKGKLATAPGTKKSLQVLVSDVNDPSIKTFMKDFGDKAFNDVNTIRALAAKLRNVKGYDTVVEKLEARAKLIDKMNVEIDKDPMIGKVPALKSAKLDQLNGTITADQYADIRRKINTVLAKKMINASLSKGSSQTNRELLESSGLLGKISEKLEESGEVGKKIVSTVRAGKSIVDAVSPAGTMYGVAKQVGRGTEKALELANKYGVRPSSVGISSKGAIRSHQDMEDDANKVEDLAKSAPDDPSLASLPPDTAEHLTATKVAAATLLREKMPKKPDPIMGVDGGDINKYVPPAQEQQKYQKYIDAVKNPLQVIREFDKGEINPEGIETLRRVYPEMYSKTSEKYINMLSDQQQFDKMSRKDKIRYSYWFDSPIDKVISPKYVANSQAVYQQQQGQQQPQVKGKMNLSQSKGTMSPSEKILSR